MKFSLPQRLPQLAALTLLLFFSTAIFAQNHQRVSQAKPAVKATPAPNFNNVVLSDCDNDQTPPVVQCPTGNCSPNARAAYLYSQQNGGSPFGYNDNFVAMEAVFGPGNYDPMYLETADLTTLLSPAYSVLFLEGSDNGSGGLFHFFNQNRAALESWVAKGGALFVNCAPNPFGVQSIEMGFGGVVLQYFQSTNYGIVQVPTHPIFNGPFTPAEGDFFSWYFLYGSVNGSAGTILITGDDGTQVGLSEKKWGAGKVFFGTMTPPSTHSPQPNAQNLRQNILADLKNHCTSTVILSADQGVCTATAAATILDATATDDCELASLIHDFAAAPATTDLAGAVFSLGQTLVRWTATDKTGNTAACEINVSVLENNPPKITCPTDLTTPAEALSCAAAVNFSVTATDDCTSAPAIYLSAAPGNYFPLGPTTVQAVATDESGNSANCSFIVTVAPNVELCNNFDDDCNGQTDDGAPADNTFYADKDSDGYGDPNNSVAACYAPPGYVTNALDCNDALYYVNPAWGESCNEIDDNCDGNVDEGVAGTYYADADADGYGDPNVSKNACNQPTGYVSNNTDCNDADDYIHPGTLEDCTNLTDENCDGILGDNNFAIAETHTDVFCGSAPDAKIQLSVSPTQVISLIRWSNGQCCTLDQSGLQSGSYKVTVTNECGTTKTKIIEIMPPATPGMDLKISGSDVLCAGDGDGSVTATVTNGCPPYSYNWNGGGSTDPSLTGLSGGYYSVVVTDACGCTATGARAIVEPAYLLLSIGYVVQLFDGTYWAQVVPFGGTKPYQFRRSIPGGDWTAWSASNGFSDIQPGDYTFEVLDKNGCANQFNYHFEPINLRASEVSERDETDDPDISKVENFQKKVFEKTDLVLFPNPTDDELNVEWAAPGGSAEGAVEIFDNAGQLLRRLPVPAGAVRVSASVADLPQGVYFLKTIGSGGIVAMEKFVKQ